MSDLNRIYSQANGRLKSLPIKPSTVFGKGDYLKWDGAGALIPIVTADGETLIVAQMTKDVLSTDDDYAVARSVSVYVPRDRYNEFVIEYTGTLVTTPGLEYEMSTAGIVDFDGTTVKAVRFLHTIGDVADKTAVFYVKFEGQY